MGNCHSAEAAIPREPEKEKQTRISPASEKSELPVLGNQVPAPSSSPTSSGNDVFLSPTSIDMTLKIPVEEPITQCNMSGVDRGVTVQFIVEFCTENNLWNEPTHLVNSMIIQPTCQAGGTDGGPCRYVDLPSMVQRGVVGRAKTFVSHAWGAPFGLIVVALLEGEPDMNRHVWIDIFAVFQFDPKPADELRFDAVIPHCTSFLLVVPYVQEIDDMDMDAAFRQDMRGISKVTFRMLPMLRIWCLAEMFAALKQLGMVVIMKTGQLQTSDDSIGGYKLDSEGHDNFLKNLFRVIDVSNAEASVDADRVRILEEHKDELAQVNAKVRGLCEVAAWLKEDASKVSLVACAAMGDAAALSRVQNETDFKTRQVFQRVCAGRGFTALLRLLLNTYPAEDRDKKLMAKAAAGGHLDCIQLLIEEKFDVDVFEDNMGQTACCMLAAGGHVQSLRLLIAAGCDVEASSSGKFTPCICAANMGHAECVRILIEAGCDFNSYDIQDGTALYYAMKNKHSDCVELLESHGAKGHKYY